MSLGRERAPGPGDGVVMVGVVSGIVGLVLLLVQGDDDASGDHVAVQADVRPGGASVTVGGRF